MSATTRKRIVLLIEDNPEARGCIGKVRQLEYACIATNESGAPRLIVKAVRDTNTHETITDPANLPPLDVVLEAAALYDWSWVNQQVYAPGIPQVNGVPFKAKRTRKPRKPREPRSKGDSPDDHGHGV